jgi:hypothetical protein
VAAGKPTHLDIKPGKPGFAGQSASANFEMAGSRWNNLCYEILANGIALAIHPR